MSEKMGFVGLSRAIGGVYVFHNTTGECQKERRAQQTFNTLLTIMEDVTRLSIQPNEPTEAAPLLPLTTIGHKLTEIIRQGLQCRSAACHSLDLQTDKCHLLGVSGLTDEEAQVYQKDVEQSFLSEYLEAEEIARLRADEVVIRDPVIQLDVQPYTDFEVRSSILAPMMLDKHLVGILTINQSSADVISLPEEIALVKAIAKLIAQVMERARVTNEWAVACANERALREANQRFDAFLCLASHELRTPLTAIKGKVQLALRRLEALTSQCSQWVAASDRSEELMPAWERIHRPLMQALHRTGVQERMISELLDASRIRANKLEVVMQSCNLIEIVQQSIEDLRDFASDRLFRLHLPEARSVLIMADADRIGQVLTNYLVNALRYSAQERPIEIALELIEEEHMARVMVRDQGMGIAPQELQYIWERFYRSHAAERQYHAGAGLGLGLYICRSIIEQHGGHVGVQSVQGQGSTFWFTLPLVL